MPPGDRLRRRRRLRGSGDRAPGRADLQLRDPSRAARQRDARRPAEPAALDHRCHHAAVGQPRPPDRDQPQDPPLRLGALGELEGLERRAEGFQAIGGDLVRFDSNALTYRLGVGRQFTDAFAGALEVSYETPKDTNMTPLAPYDGYTAISVGGTYTLASRVDLSAGLAYDLLGDADVEANGVIARVSITTTRSPRHLGSATASDHGPAPMPAP